MRYGADARAASSTRGGTTSRVGSQRVPDERDFVGLDRSERGLIPVRCEQCGGWWFVNLDPTAMPLLEWLSPAPRRSWPTSPARPLRLFDVKSVELHCNWKILAEGFLEVYHARTVHPTTVAPTLDTRGTVISLFDHGHQNMISPVKPGTRTDNREALAIDPPAFRRCSRSCSSPLTGSSRT